MDAEATERDRWRLAVFDAVAGIRAVSELAGRTVPAELREAIQTAARRRRTPNAVAMFHRLSRLDPAHRLVLLKAAAEWIVARYQRGLENWERQYDEWDKEKRAWEDRHPQLTAEVREQFTDIFRNLIENPTGDGPKGVRRKNPRICLHERLRQEKDNCVYAGQKGHGPLCWKYQQFLKELKGNRKYFLENAEKYLKVRLHLEQPEQKRKLRTSPRQEAFARLYRQSGMEKARGWFTDAWKKYLEALGIKEETIIQSGRLPHCQAIGECFEKSKCEWNPHTHLCNVYKQALAALDPDQVKLEGEYREWRRHYLAAPRKPSFRYPSSRKLPIPKILGGPGEFHEVDFDRSVLRLRLDDMRPGEWIEFGFVPWPKGYRPCKNEVKVTSIHVNFIGRRARAGFRFETLHRPSRFTCLQDEIDQLRSRQFPRQSQDQQFLEAARQRLLESFMAEKQQLRILAVDLGESGAYAASYLGRSHQADVPLRIVKIDQCYSHIPDVLKIEESHRPPPRFDKDKDWRGLRKEHVGRHLEQLRKGGVAIAKYRKSETAETVGLGDADYRGLSRHVRWMIRDWARHNAAQIIAAAEERHADLIVFESLRGFQPRGYDDMDLAQKRRLAFFAFGRIRRKVVEKAVERGMRVVTVPYGFSSQVCASCGHVQHDKARLRRNKKQRIFACECGDGKAQAAGKRQNCNCREKIDSDKNAARVLARVFWGEIVLPSRVDNS